MLCTKFVRISGPDTVECERFGNNWPARETKCAFFQREPGADDEVDPEFWRGVMERIYPPKPHVPLKPRTAEEARAIMGLSYDPVEPVPIAADRRDAIDREEEAEAVAAALGASGLAEYRLLHDGCTALFALGGSAGKDP